MPEEDGIVKIAIDIGAINEAKKRIVLRRLVNDPDFAKDFRNGMLKAMDNICDIMRRMFSEDDSDKT